MTWIQWSLLIALLATAVGYDVTTRRIPNWLVVAGFTGAQMCGAFGLSDIGPGSSLLGALTGLAVMFPLFLLRVMGAGDAKLVAAVGAVLGPDQVLGAVLLTFAAGGALSLGAALFSRSLSRVLANLRLMLFVVVAGRSSGVSVADVNTTGRLPYAIAIMAGTGLQVWLAARGGWFFA